MSGGMSAPLPKWLNIMAYFMPYKLINFIVDRRRRKACEKALNKPPK